MKEYVKILLLFLISSPVFAHHQELLLNKASHDANHLMYDLFYALIGLVAVVLLVKRVTRKRN
ncbi:MAG: hypothetical protein OQL06_06945 [Gammaproteobacteria bacterium]|nr:hypothetical protein [Gammaproteobacteria bacterium]